MADYNFTMKNRQDPQSPWDNLYPKTKSDNVIMSNSGTNDLVTQITSKSNQTSLDNTNTNIGTLSSLLTIVKTSIVNAINELVNNKVNNSDVVTTATANKILKLDSNSKLPASITGDSASVGGQSATILCPTGTVLTFAMSTPPTGWLKCNGQAVSRTTYANLFALIGTTFGTGDGSTTFNLPDLRGQFIRGFDDGKGVDSGRTFGSAQADDFKAHTHSTAIHPSGEENAGYGLTSSVSFTDRVMVNGTGTSVQSSSTGGTETRPKNIALLYCIRY